MRDKRQILLIDDDAVDQESLRRAFRELKIVNPLVVKRNAEEGLSFLRDSANSVPCLILLDLQMPGMGGLEFLKTIKGDEGFKKIPVVCLTTSREEQDKVQSFTKGAAGYIVKPPTHVQLIEAVRTLDLYWTLSEMP